MVDGQQIMLDARELKNIDEVTLLNQAASMVDGVYHMIYEELKPGVRENDIVAKANKMLYEMFLISKPDGDDSFRKIVNLHTLFYN